MSVGGSLGVSVGVVVSVVMSVGVALPPTWTSTLTCCSRLDQLCSHLFLSDLLKASFVCM